MEIDACFYPKKKFKKMLHHFLGTSSSYKLLSESTAGLASLHSASCFIAPLFNTLLLSILSIGEFLYFRNFCIIGYSNKSYRFKATMK